MQNIAKFEILVIDEIVPSNKATLCRKRLDINVKRVNIIG